ncbi:hypothetical protein C5O19_11290 [Siphonobacter curvatus]|uniref:Uncharacterized protein n=1 Tax=Siphonobacter curvatus TaxID=2094562 RepID=A0A2S7IR23_9BACT|nr:hypothetical protein C5O19_11290 [Siphonobacter curvatus]
MYEIFELLKPFSHLQGLRFVAGELVFQWRCENILFWISYESETYKIYIDGEFQHATTDTYEVARYFSLLGL